MYYDGERIVPGERFEPFEPEEILHDLDGPRTFTFRNRQDELFLAHWCDDSVNGLLYAVVPFSTAILKRLKSGDITVRDALDQPHQWMVEVAHDWRILKSSAIEFERLPSGTLPERDVMLYANPRPLFTVRAQGDEIVERFIPSNVLRTTIERAEKAIKVVVEQVLGATTVGRPAASTRRYYNLPTQRLAFGSFEISFRQPTIPAQLEFGEIERDLSNADDKVFEQVSDLLQRGLLETRRKGELSSTGPNSAEWVTIVNALENLCPTSQGPVTTIELSGRLLEGGSKPLKRFTLKKSDRAYIRRAKASLVQVRSDDVRLTGRIRQLDRDAHTFELREIVEGLPDITFVYEDQFLDIIVEAIGPESEEKAYRVIGIRESQTAPYSVLAVLPANENAQIF
jgi:hypothetical protein